jgi:steroid 5-alpha reductase family enzyme
VTALSLVETGLLGLALITASMTVVWLASLVLRDASIADIFWGPGFIVIAAFYAWIGTPHPRLSAMVALVTMWGLRLAVHLARRHRGEDLRYAAMRAVHGQRFPVRSLFIVFWLQGALLWAVALPLLVVSRHGGPDALTIPDAIGGLMFAAGFAFEVVADRQLERFKATRSRPSDVLDSGLWRYTRHPNYFGDALLWWGLWVISTSAQDGWMTIGSPLLMTILLLRVSGVTLLERTLVATKPTYAAYAARTSAFVPWLPTRVHPSHDQAVR